MKKIRVWCETNMARGSWEDVIEVEDDATDTEIEQAAKDWASNYFSWGWDDAAVEESGK